MDPHRRVNPDRRRALPPIDRLVRDARSACPELPLWAVTEAARQVVADARRRLESGGDDDGEGRELWVDRISRRAARLARVHPRPVVNATGVVLHTNLGRAPLAHGAAVAALAAAESYSDLELDLETGRRGNRQAALAEKIGLLSGAEAATLCNNNAAAVLLALDTLGRGREVVVSRGELVEIGGSFRIPDIMERAGVRLVEVGTTNRTHARDYERAIGPDTALLLKVHRSNFEQTGFVAEVELAELAAIARRHGLPVVEDLGSGSLLDLTDRGLPAEAFAPARLRQGADLVAFSGDKLLGGPQAGIAIGRRQVVDAMRSNPLARALRVDKMTLAALDWTVRAILEDRAEEIPVVRCLLETPERLELNARALGQELAAVAGELLAVSVEADTAPVGGGSLPGFELETWVVALRGQSGGAGGHRGAQALAEALRRAPAPVIARVRDDSLLLDMRTVAAGELPAIVESMRVAVGELR